ncbi:MAG: CPBP family intramembrane metalloprotease [Muribaculaceae bacterium]|nr:CPBP family intramembrane metalloprotease [Muribaculaceae bacterium]
MNKLLGLLKSLMPILAAAYGTALIYITALPLDSDSLGFGGELLSWLLTLAGIGLTVFLVQRVEPKLFPVARQFQLKRPMALLIVGLLLIAPLWFVAKEYILYGLTCLVHTVQLEPLTTYTTSELREELLGSVHAVLLAPILEELCFRQMAISPFRSRRAQIAVCVVMALLFGMLHVRNFPGAFINALFYGAIFIWSRNIWNSVALHAGCNLTATLLAVYCWLGLGDLQMAKMPAIILTDAKVVVGSIVLAVVGLLLIYSKRNKITKQKTISS